MGPLGIPELLFILVLALLIFGPKKLPEIGKTLGKAMGEFRRATSDLKRSIDTEIALEEKKSLRPTPASGPAGTASREYSRPDVAPAAPPDGDTVPAAAAPAAEPAPVERAATEPEGDDASDPAAVAARAPSPAERDSPA